MYLNTSRYSFIVLLFTLIYQTGYCEGLQPVLSENGQVKMICLLDIHKSYSSADKECSDFQPKTMFVALTALWKWNSVSNVSGTYEKIGLTVYDTCGSERRAVQILSSYLSDTSQAKSIAGVITYTSPEVTTVVYNMLRHMDIIHMQIRNDNSPACQWSKTESCLSFPLHTDYRAEMALEVAGVLNWTYISVFGLRDQNVQSDVETFVNLTAGESVCIASTQELNIDELTSLGLPEVKSTAAVVFTGDALLGAVAVTTSTVLVVTTELPPRQVENDNVLFLLEETPKLEGIFEFLRNLVSSNVTLNVEGGYLQTDSECFREANPKRSEIQLKCVSLLKTNYEYLAVADAVSLLHRVTMETLRSNCLDDVVSCSSAKSELAFINNELSFFSFNGRKMALRRPTFRLVLPGNASNETQITGNLVSPQSIPDSFYNSQCGDACFECKTCLPPFYSDERVMFDDADILLVGIFPIHTSASGRTCSVPNIKGFKVAQAFTNAIQLLSKNTTSLPVSVGSVVFDSCGDKTWFSTKYREVENCLYRYRDYDDKDVIIQPSKTVAYFNMDEFSGFSSYYDTSKLTLTVSDIGITFDNWTSGFYVETILKIVQKSKWTYLYLLVSDNQLLKSKAEELKAKASEYDICLAGIVMLEHNASSGDILENSFANINKARQDVATFILLTSEQDTIQLFNRLLITPYLKPRLKVFVFSWQLYALQINNLEKIIDETVVMWPKLTSSLSLEALSHGNPWFEQFQNPLSENGSSADILQLIDYRLTFFMYQAVKNFISSASTAFQNTCPQHDLLCKEFSDFKNLKKKIEPLLAENVKREQNKFDINSLRFKDGLTTTQKVGEVSEDGEVRFIQDSSVTLPAASECRGWCPQCRRCQAMGRRDEHLLYLQGDVLISGVFPVHQRGESTFTCGLVSGMLGSERAVEAFMFAIESAKSRYPYLLPSVTVGGLVFDSCSDVSYAVHSIGNFESCLTPMLESGSLAPDPRNNMGYLLDSSKGVSEDLSKAMKHIGKIVLSVDSDEYGTPSLVQESAGEQEAISSILLHLNWTDVIVLATNSNVHIQFVQSFMQTAARKNICVFKTIYFDHYNSSSLETIAKELTRSPKIAVVVLAYKMDTLKLFQHSSIIKILRPWLISVVDDDWRTLADAHFPHGSILVDKKGKYSKDFEDYSHNFRIQDSGLNSWWRQYWQERFQCRLPGMDSKYNSSCPPTYVSREQPSTTAAKIIKGVDIILHSIHERYMKVCPGSLGLCPQFLHALASLPSLVQSVSFEFEQETVKFAHSYKLEASYLISNYQPQGPVKVGQWHDFHLQLDFNKVKFYNEEGQELSTARYSQCIEDCVCLNINVTKLFEMPAQVYDAARFSDSSGTFNGVLWTTVILAVASSGAFISFVLMIYVLYKVCCGALAKRHVWLGLILLAGVILLYLSVIPFTFTPSEGVCGLRYFAPGFSYALCFASILVKLTSLRDYRLIGLGGEVSNLNQMLSVLFICGVQLAVGVQYWAQNKPMLVTKTLGSITVFACAFEKGEFAVYLIYIMILILTCSIYGIGVRKERKNMGEAKLLLTCSWLCIVVWIAWLIVFFVLGNEFMDASICVAILACATLMLVGIFIPKIHLVSRLKYDVSKHATGTMSNGYKVDPDFFFERPYSLPGTMTSSYSSVKTFPKSITHFDSSMSY